MKKLCCIFAIIGLIYTIKAEECHILPMLLSASIPGGGQFYHGKVLKGSIYAAAELGFLYGAFIQDQRYREAKDNLADFSGSTDSYEYKKNNHEINFYQKERNNFIWYSAASVLLSIGDAFVDSYFVDFKRDKFANLEITPRHNGLTLGYNF